MATEHLALARERLGQVLRDRWLLEKVIGVGGMAAVYQARHRNGARVAIKLLHAQVGDDQVVRERFLREAYLANSIEHPNVARVLDDDADPIIGPFIVMELLEGSSLLDRLERGETFSPTQAMVIADQTLDVLSAAHRRGIVHRDLKPANLFISVGPNDEPIVHVLDFGIARIIEDNQARLTRTGVPLGTPAYMAPEQARGMGRHVDGRADLYALGATLFRTLAGRHVHIGVGADQIVKVATERAPSLSVVAPHVPREVCMIVDRSLQFEIDRRYGSAEEMQTDVRAVLSGRRPRQPRLPTPALPAPRTAPKVDVDALAESLRAEAHRNARRPDAFSAAAPPPAPPTDDEDDNLPTAVLPPKQTRQAIAEARAIAAQRQAAQQRPMPSEPPRRVPSSASFPAIKNVPVPTLTPHAGISAARNAPVVDHDHPQTMTAAGAIVLPPVVPTKFEDTQYQMEHGAQPPRSSGHPASAPHLGSSGEVPAAPPSRPFAQTLADPSAMSSARYALDALSSPETPSFRGSGSSSPQRAAPSAPWSSHASSPREAPRSSASPQNPRPQEQPTTPSVRPAPTQQPEPAERMSTATIVFAVFLALIVIVVVVAIVRTM